ncbi:unnamed protein product [Polarella glacialis]|uniref:AB hydrolase-1 domain-containing protein n=1 Tax=Polarella glacialis TaxID=89957 RepID=A0A813JKM0_POLGL|nr:unnamed protein product [Polarella glacialis]CAE8677502.1 unnamed protein product [Polarella glacialis]
MLPVAPFSHAPPALSLFSVRASLQGLRSASPPLSPGRPLKALLGASATALLVLVPGRRLRKLRRRVSEDGSRHPTGATSGWTKEGCEVCSQGPGYIWEWRPGVQVHFDRLAPTGGTAGSGSQDFAVVMVHGFGAESGYFDQQLKAVAAAGGTAYAMDLFGQGGSWPTDDPAPNGGSPGWSPVEGGAGDEEWGWGNSLDPRFAGSHGAGLAFGEPAWLEQLTAFVQNVVTEGRVYLLGNSLGGYLAAKVSARGVLGNRVSGLILANATPFWGWFDEGGLAPWDGHLPAPWWVRPIASTWFKSLRSNIGSMLGLVYARAGDLAVQGRLDALAGRISDAAAHPMGAAAFASILFAPRQSPSFGDALDQVAANGLPVLLLYGDDDPWVVPFWAQRAAGRVREVGEYYGLSPAGHCPHHEAPDAFNEVLVSWLRRREADPDAPEVLQVGTVVECRSETSGQGDLIRMERRL